MPWFKKQPVAKKLAESLNQKYENFDVVQSSRPLYSKQFRMVIKNLVPKKMDRVIFVGGNDGHEASYLPSKPTHTYINDLAAGALKKVKGNTVTAIYANAEHLPFIDKYFDCVFGFRVFFSTHTDYRACLKESKRILKSGGTLVATVPNGCLVNGKLVTGMFNYAKGDFDTALPLAYQKKCVGTLKSLGFKNIHVSKLPAEIVISATKAR